MLQRLFEMLGLNWIDFAVFVLLVVALAYWWFRKSAKHPDQARGLEAKADAGVADLMRRAGVGEDVIAKVVGFDATGAGADAYAAGEALISAKVEQAARLLREASNLRTTLKG